MNEKFIKLVIKSGYTISFNWKNGMIAVFDGRSGYLLINCCKYLNDDLNIDDIYIGVQIEYKIYDMLNSMNKDMAFKYLISNIVDKDLTLFYTTVGFLMKRQYKFME